VSASETIEIMKKLLRDVRPHLDAEALHTLATVAADAYLEYVELVDEDARQMLLVSVLEGGPFVRVEHSHSGGRRAERLADARC
jgi:hypothetical protein